MTEAINLFKAYSTDATAEQEGTLTPLPGCGDTKWLIARSGNKHYNRLLSSLFKKHRSILESKGDAAEAKSEEILVEVFAKTILKGFEGTIPGPDGKMTAYSENFAKQLLAMKDFRAKVAAASEDFNTFLSNKEEEEDAKN